MAVLFPDAPYPLSAKPSMLDFGGLMVPALGGPTQRIQRLGTRFQVAYSMPTMTEDQAEAWIAAQAKSVATGAPVSMLFPQKSRAGQVGYAPGAPAVNGAGQSGTTLNAKGFTPHFRVRPGAFFCFTLNSRSYLHMVTDAVLAAADGTAALSIAPMLRVSPADSAALNFSAPRIEGWLLGQSLDWQIDRLRYYGVSFSVQEAE